MRKTFYYNFLPTKAEEVAASARNGEHPVTRTIVEIRDRYEVPGIDPMNPWQIRRPITRNEVACGEILLSHEETFEHVFRYWNLELANHVVQGNKCFVVLIDYTEENMPKVFQSSYVKSEGANCDTYALGLMDVLRCRVVNRGDEIGLFWDIKPATYGFGFKLFRRVKSITSC